MTLNDLVKELRKLLPQERQALRDMLEREQQNGTAARLADGSDPQEYVNRLREAWHDRVKIHANSAR
jgi:uncharacterized protein (UPF0216 family)